MQRNDKLWHATIWGILNLLLISGVSHLNIVDCVASAETYEGLSERKKTHLPPKLYEKLKTSTQGDCAKLAVPAFESKKNNLGAPTFLPTPTNVTVNTGEQAILQCAIANLGTKTVSWLKKLPKKHPLTVGTYTFIEDANISVFHNNRTHEWNLLIKDVKISHSGVYECQVSSTEKLSRLVQLTVKDGVSKPSVHISGTAYVENTEVIEITCNATSGGRPPRDITWFKDGEIITPDPNNDRIQIRTHVHMVARSLISKLVIERSHLEDAGIYVCRTSDLKATEFKVHVLNTYANDNTSTSHRRRHDNYDHKGHGGKRSGDDSGSLTAASFNVVCFILTQVVYWCLMMQPS